jgi:O-methyltransferase
MDAAFAILNSLKARRARVQDVDYLRALCFGQKQPLAAIEALKEELRYFPENLPAARMLKDLLSRSAAESQVGDAEFLQILEVIQPYTMVGEARLFSLFRLAKRVCEEDLPGNFVECGVAAGGSSALLATVILRHSKRSRKLYAFDTFEGMPKASALDVHAGTPAEAAGWGAGTCSAPQRIWSSLYKACLRRPFRSIELASDKSHFFIWTATGMTRRAIF